MRTTILSVFIFVTVLTVPFVPEHCHADGQDGELIHHDNAAVQISPSENRSDDWVAIFSPEGLTTVALLRSFIMRHLSGQPFTWQELEAAKAKPSSSHVHQLLLLCGIDERRKLDFKNAIGALPFEWVPGDRCRVQVKDDVDSQGSLVWVQYKILISGTEPGLLRLSWLTVPLPTRFEGPTPLPNSFVIGQDGQPHPGIRDFPYMTTILDAFLWSLSFLSSPTVSFPVIGALLALLGCVNWHGYCRGLDIGPKTFPAFQSVTDYVGHSLEILVSLGALAFIGIGAIFYIMLLFVLPLLHQKLVFNILMFAAGALGPPSYGLLFEQQKLFIKRRKLLMIQLAAYGFTFVLPVALSFIVAVLIYPLTRHWLPARIPTIVLSITLILTCLWEAYIRGIYDAKCLLLSSPNELKFSVSAEGQCQEVMIIRSFSDSILGLIPSSKKIVVFPAADIRMQKSLRAIQPA
jgi:hypothetical protein